MKWPQSLPCTCVMSLGLLLPWERPYFVVVTNKQTNTNQKIGTKWLISTCVKVNMVVGAREDPIHHPYHCGDTQIILRSIEFIPILLRRMGWDQFFSSMDPDSRLHSRTHNQIWSSFCWAMKKQICLIECFWDPMYRISCPIVIGPTFTKTKIWGPALSNCWDEDTRLLICRSPQIFP
jgi:hypothetical protein